MNHENCHHLLDDLSDFLDGEASEEVCAEIERHLAGCENCRVMVDTLQKTIILYRDLPQPSIPPNARERLYHALDLDAFLPKN